MKRTVIAALLAAGPLGVAAYACTTDTFTGGDGGDAIAPATQAEFCDAETRFATYCKYIDAACTVDNLTRCGQAYSAFSSAFTNAITRCASQDQIPCDQTFFTALGIPGCMQNEIGATVNDSGAFVQLTTDYCNGCGVSNPACGTSFASAPDKPGYLASLASDLVINQIDSLCAKAHDAGPVTVGDASVTCDQWFTYCAIIELNGALPTDSCKDGG